MIKKSLSVKIPREFVDKFRALGGARWLAQKLDLASPDDVAWGHGDVKERPASQKRRGRPFVFPNGCLNTTLRLCPKHCEKFRCLGGSHWLRRKIRDADLSEAVQADKRSG